MEDSALMPQARPLRTSPWFLGALLFALLFWILDLAWLRAGVPHPLDDTWEDGIVARLLLHGQWFRTHMIYPPLWGLHDPRTLTLPVLVHGPLVPVVLAAPLAVVGPGLLDHVAWIAAGFAVLALIPIFRLAARHFDEPVAAGAAGLFTLSPLTISSVDHYLTVVVGAFLLAWTLDLLARPRPRPVAAGLVAGLCYLARPEMLLAAPVLAFLAAAGRTRRPGAPAFIAGFVAAASWWWWERWRASGSPFFNLSSYMLICFSPAHPGDGLVRDFAATPARFPSLLAAALPTLWLKWAHLLPRAIKRVLTTPSEATGWLAVVGAFAAFHRRELRRVVTCAALLAAIPGVMITLLAPVRDYPVPFLPLYGIAAAQGARWLLERLPSWAHRPRAWMGALALLAIPSAGIELRLQWSDARNVERWLAFDRAGLVTATAVPGSAPRLLFSDTPDFVAWTTGRPTVALRHDEFERLYRRGGMPPPGIPAPPRREDTWFHAGNLNDPAGQRGFRLEEE